MEHLTQKICPIFVSFILRALVFAKLCRAATCMKAFKSPPVPTQLSCKPRAPKGLVSSRGAAASTALGCAVRAGWMHSPIPGTKCPHPGRETEDSRKGGCSWLSLRKRLELLKLESKHRSSRTDRRSPNKAGHQIAFKCLQSVFQDGSSSL